MARTITEIQQQIIAAKDAEPVLSAHSWSTSKVAIWRLWTYITAVCIWSLEQLFDYHKAEVAALLAASKPHTLQWYTSMAKKFQNGQLLPDGSDVYAVITEDPAIRIVKYAAATELSNLIRVKVAKESSGMLAKLTTGELDAFTAYMKRIKDAGIRLQLTSDDPDTLQLAVAIYYDPLVLTASGARVDGTSPTPVLDGINTFLANLPFDGVFILNELIAAIQGIDGVKIGHVISAQANYALTPFVPITVKYTPDAGYMRLDVTYFNTAVTYTAA